jgi:acetyl-CoA acetyltransferase
MNHVYVLDFNDRIKIGRTADVPRRIHDIENASGQKPTRHFSIEADPVYETVLHDRLSEHRGVGEYFTYPYEEAVALLQRLIAENFAEKARLERERQRLEREKERQEAAQAKKQERQARKIAIKAPEIGETSESDTDEPVKFINIRLKETEYKSLAKHAIDAGITKAAFCKIASLYVDDMIGQGAFSIRGGVLIDRRG